MSKRLRKKNALRRINSAFSNITLEDGISLRETVEIDHYRTVPKSSKARDQDEVNDWRKLLDSTVIQELCWIGGIHFFDPKGFKFHIPAYLSLAIRQRLNGDIFQSLISCLVNPGEYRQDGFELFDDVQRKAIFEAIMFLHDFEFYPLDEQEMAGAKRHWG
ncbi:DUF6714 family protein [Hahella aquimaris]|uniref:DUF6714 family protein n=1 Tax=Hahella sp. HNIBRBA332 TaxID=3015983 RepID=UPI00352DFA15